MKKNVLKPIYDRMRQQEEEEDRMLIARALAYERLVEQGKARPGKLGFDLAQHMNTRQLRWLLNDRAWRRRLPRVLVTNGMLKYAKRSV